MVTTASMHGRSLDRAGNMIVSDKSAMCGKLLFSGRTWTRRASNIRGSVRSNDTDSKVQERLSEAATNVQRIQNGRQFVQ